MKIMKTKSASFLIYRKSIQAKNQTTMDIYFKNRRALRITI